MFRWIFAAQAVVYFLLMPYLRAQGELGYHPPLLPGLLAIGALLVGVNIGGKNFMSSNLVDTRQSYIEPRTYLWAIICALVVAYAIVSITFGLINRRLGSEYMAALYADMPLPALAILRGYEIIFIPASLVFAFSKAVPRYQRVAVSLAIIASLPFMGVADSRGRLLVIVLFLLCFVKSGTVIKNFYSNFRYYCLGLIVFGAFFFYSYERASNYYSLNDYVAVEVYQRLDGLNLATQLQDAHLLDYWGQYDGRMFEPLISKIPFLDAAQEAKLLGRTSTKQYYLQDLLKSSQLDDSNSMIADPLYFAGLAGVIFCFLGLGYFIARFDNFIDENRMFTTWASSIVATAFVSTFAIIEQDFVGSIAAFFQTMVVIGLFFVIGCQRRVAQPQAHIPAVGPQSSAESPAAV